MSELIFAYGSNMCLGRFLDYMVHPEGPGEAAELQEYSLRFNKRSDDGSGKGNIEREDGGTVWGVLYRIPDADLPVLHAGEGTGYIPRRMRVVSASGPVEAWVHVARRPSGDASLSPY